MSIYYELRGTGRLSFKDRTDPLSMRLKNFFKSLTGLPLEDKKSRMLDLSKDFLLENTTGDLKIVLEDLVLYTESNRVYEMSFWNNFAEPNEPLDFKITEIESDVFDIDFCIGNKNRDSNLELLAILLLDYINDDFIFIWYDENMCSKRKPSKDILSNYVKSVNEEPYSGICIFDLMELIEECSEDFPRFDVRDGLVL